MFIYLFVSLFMSFLLVFLRVFWVFFFFFFFFFFFPFVCLSVLAIVRKLYLLIHSPKGLLQFIHSLVAIGFVCFRFCCFVCLFVCILLVLYFIFLSRMFLINISIENMTDILT